MKRRGDIKKIGKRNTHKRRSKEESKKELIRAISATGVSFDGAKLGYSCLRHDGFVGERSENKSASGIFMGSKNGYGFVRIDGEESDIFIPRDKTRGSIDGDRVEIVYHKYINRDGEKKSEGRVTRILEMAKCSLIGEVCEELSRHGRRVFRTRYLAPTDPKISLRPRIVNYSEAECGDKVEVCFKRDGTLEPPCEVIRIFGRSDSREANYSAILSEYSIPEEFSEEELSPAKKLSEEEVSFDGREDLTRETVFTIDGEGAKDLDDAVSLRRIGDGWRLGVHIADVSHYVPERSALDRCAMSRQTSVYFTDKVIPMLPETLSNGACSLNAGENKYTVSAIIDLDSEGRIGSLKLKRGVIRSRLRGVYSEVNAIFDKTASPEIKRKYKSVIPTLEKMKSLYEILKRRSEERACIDLNRPEAVIILADRGEPIAIERRERGLAERMIEQFMLTANEAVATYLSERDIPAVYRVHEQPPKEQLSQFLGYLESLGFLPRELCAAESDRAFFPRILKEAENRGISDAVSYAMLRAMAKAKYSDKCEGHFGLGIEKYCHFTSPIRRLSDLATHRIINRVIFDKKDSAAYRQYAKRAAAAASDGELRALGAEREIEDLYKVIFMSDKVGETFSATVSSLAGFGIFAMLDNTVEGLIPMSELPGVFRFDERNLTMVSRERIYRISDRIKVRLEEANVSRGKLRFSLAEAENDN